MRLDLHIHSRYSPDSKLDPIDIVRTAKQRGLQGIAITDHNAVEGVGKAWEYGRDHGLLVVRGTEVSTEDGHVLAYGLTHVVARGRCCRDTVDDILALGGVPVAAHPFRFWSGLGERETTASPFAAYEVQNARTLRSGNAKARTLAAERRLPGIGGSDAHFLDEVGRAVTIADDATTEEELLEALRKGEVRAEGQDRGSAATVRYVTKCVGEWLLRGMRRI